MAATVPASPTAILPKEEDLPPSAVLDTLYGGLSADGVHTKRQTPPFNMQTLQLMTEAWKHKLHHTSTKEKVGYVILFLVVLASLIIQFFGINWWLATFPSKTGPSAFVQMIAPALLWQLSFALPTIPYKFCMTAPTEDFFFWLPEATAREEQERVEGAYDGQSKDWRGVRWLLALGLIDALGGLTAVYSIPKVAPFLQTMIFATSPMVTWALSKLLSPAKAPPINPWLITTFVMSLAGVCVASVQQFEAATSQTGSFGWIFIFFLSSAFPNLYNVMQGRFLTHYQHAPNVSHWTAKIISLVGDTTSQIFIVWFFFPLDSLPWFGNSSNMHETWEGTVKGFHTIFTDGEGFVYFMLYILGYVLSRASNAFLNHYSPTLGAFILQFGSPVIALLLVVVPQWDVHPGNTKWYLQVICLILLFFSALMYSVYEEACRAHEAAQRLKEEEERTRHAGGFRPLADGDDERQLLNHPKGTENGIVNYQAI